MTGLTTQIAEVTRQALRSVPDLPVVLRAAEAERQRLALYGPLRWLALALPLLEIAAGQPFGDWAEWLGLGTGVVDALALWSWYVARVDDLADTLGRGCCVPRSAP